MAKSENIEALLYECERWTPVGLFRLDQRTVLNSLFLTLVCWSHDGHTFLDNGAFAVSMMSLMLTWAHFRIGCHWLSKRTMSETFLHADQRAPGGKDKHKCQTA